MTDDLNNYSAYCTALKNGSSMAAMMFELRSWIIKEVERIRTISNGNNYIGLDDLEAIDALDMKYDMISHIVCESMASFFRIYDRMREKNARENIVMPVQKAREINSSTIVWLCSQPGRTAREKIGNSNNKVMAVNRFISYDTPENRLLIACARLLCTHIQEKLNTLGERYCSREELTFLNKTNAFLYSDQAKSISAWSNTPPNNALISDRNYKKIWNAWTALKELDDLVKNDCEKIKENSFTLFKVELIAELKKRFLLPQLPLTVDYSSFHVDFAVHVINGCDGDGNSVRIVIDSNGIKVEYRDEIFHFSSDVIVDNVFSVHDDLIKRTKAVIAKMNLPSACYEHDNSSELTYSEKKYIDIASAIPFISDSLGNVYDGGLKILYQECVNDNNSGCLLSCFNSDVLIVDDSTRTFTIKSATEQDRMDVLQKIFSRMKKSINSNSLTMLINDGYDAFQLKNYKKSARSCFGSVDLFPESIGAVFWYQYISDRFADYKMGDMVIVVNLIGNSYSITPISSAHLNQAKQEGFVWERYPTKIENTELIEILEEKLMKVGCSKSKAEELLNAFGLRSLHKAVEHLHFNFESRETQSLYDYLHNIDDGIRVNVTEKVDSVIYDMLKRSNLHNQNAHVIVLSETLMYLGKYDVVFAQPNDVILGSVRHDLLFSEWDLDISETLWRDHLPDLSIRRLFGEFPLIKNAKRNPVLGQKQKIEIKDKFTLRAGKKEYRFELIQNDNGSDLQYEAVIRNDAFPLRHDTECRLNMYYQYDADDVYTLEFEPVDKLNAEFRKAKVEFVKSGELEYKGLPSPVFPPEYTWNELKAMTVGKNNEGVIDTIVRALEELETNMSKPRVRFDLKKNAIELQNDKTLNIFFEIMTVSGRKIGLIEYDNFVHKEDISESAEYLSMDLEENDRYEVQIKNNRNICWPRDKKFFILNNYYADGIGGPINILFHERNFKCKDDYSPDIDAVVFNIVQTPEGRYKAINIALKLYAEQITVDYIAKNIQVDTMYDDSYLDPKRSTLFSTSVVAFHTLYENGKSIYDEDCPENFREIGIRMVENMPKWYNGMRRTCEFPNARGMLLNRMNIMSRDMNDEYKKIIIEVVRECCENNTKLPDYLGYVLGDLSYDYQKTILNYFVNSNYWDRMDVFASNAWKNRKFIFNLDFNTVKHYIVYSIREIVSKVYRHKYKDYKYLHSYMEFVLACFRLRELNNDEMSRYLSLNNKDMRKLYNSLQRIISNKIPIKTILKLQIRHDNNKYDKLTYAVACYITGDMEEDDIIISVDEDN